MGAEDEYRSIPRMALRNAERFGDNVAVIDGDQQVTFAEVADAMLDTARALLAGGVEPGDRVALWAPNSTAWITTALGVLASGAWLVPLNTRFKGHEAAFVLGTTRARTLLCANGFLGAEYVAMVRAVDPALPALGDTVIIDGEPVEGTSTRNDFVARGSAVPASRALDRIAAIQPRDVSDIIFTSGTTGHPKGVMLRHGTSMRCFELYNQGYQLGPDDRILVVPPFFHCFGYKAGWMLALMVGATTVPVAVFDPAAALAAIEDLRITHTGGAPAMFWAMLDHQTRPDRDLSSLRVAIASAAYVPVQLVERMRRDLGVEHVVSGYGLTEAHALVSAGRPEDSPETVANWSGQVLQETEFRIVDDKGADIPVGERGELLVRGFNLMDGYYDDPEATAAVIDRDGWLHTGDIAYANAERYIKVCDRKKDMFIVSGFNVAPAEVEGILVDWDRVAAAAVIGVPDAHHGEVGVAFVVPTPGVALTGDEVIVYARERLANYKVPRRVELVDALPLNATGKVLKNELRSRLAPATS